jgi:hypothetical protein
MAAQACSHAAALMPSRYSFLHVSSFIRYTPRTHDPHTYRNLPSWIPNPASMRLCTRDWCSVTAHAIEAAETCTIISILSASALKTRLIWIQQLHWDAAERCHVTCMGGGRHATCMGTRYCPPSEPVTSIYTSCGEL